MSNENFKNHPDLTEYFETSDEQKFYKEDLAKDHARTLEDKTVKTVSRSEDSAADDRETAKQIFAKLPEMDLATAVEYLHNEENDNPRKSVVAALIKRIAELEGTQNGSEGNNLNPEA